MRTLFCQLSTRDGLQCHTPAHCAPQTLFLAAKQSHVSDWLLVALQTVNFLQLTTFSAAGIAAAAGTLGSAARLRE